MTNHPMVYMVGDSRVEDLSRDDLIEALKEAIGEISDLRESAENDRKMFDLFQGVRG